MFIKKRTYERKIKLIDNYRSEYEHFDRYIRELFDRVAKLEYELAPKCEHCHQILINKKGI